MRLSRPSSSRMFVRTRSATNSAASFGKSIFRSSAFLRRMATFVSRSGGRSTFQTTRSEEHTSELQSQSNLVCRLLLEKKKNIIDVIMLGLNAFNDFDSAHIDTDIHDLPLLFYLAVMNQSDCSFPLLSICRISCYTFYL